MNNINHELHEKGLISSQQYEFLEGIRTNKVVSLYFELRLILYLGIMLLTGGLGYIAYQNMGSFGHIISMLLIFAGIVGCFYFVNKQALPYSNAEVNINHPYFDYILILGALLIIALFTYITIYFSLIELINVSTLLSAALLLYFTYRYDNTALLSMGLVAFAATVGINISPMNWATGELLQSSNLYVTAILLGIGYYVVGHLSEQREIKAHFRFTYQNFGLMLYFVGLISAIFISDFEVLFALWLLISAVAIGYFSWDKREFLFFLYAVISGYIAFTYLFYKMLDAIDAETLMIFYVPFSCIGLVAYLIINKKHFTNER